MRRVYVKLTDGESVVIAGFFGRGDGIDDLNRTLATGTADQQIKLIADAIHKGHVFVDTSDAVLTINWDNVLSIST